MTASPPPATKRQRTRTRLLEAGTAVFCELGDRLTILHVVRRAGVSNGTFYNYFDDREALIEAVVVDVLAGLVDGVAVEGPDDPAERFATATLGILRTLELRPHHAQVLVHLAARPGVVDGLLAHMRADLDVGRASRRFAESADEVAYEITAGLIFVMLRRIAHGGIDDTYLATRVQRLLELLGIPSSEAAMLVAAVPHPTPHPGALP